MKNSRKLFILLILILIAILLFTIVQIYAKYLSAIEGSSNIQVARWDIKVNTLSIKTNTDFSSKVEPVFISNSNVASNVIAPSVEGYFDISLDWKDSDVSFKYDITTSLNDTSPVKDIKPTGYSILNTDGTENSSSIVNFDDYICAISDTITLDSSNTITSKTIRIHFKWIEDESAATMDNANDTLSTTSTEPITFTIKVSLTQVK